MRRNILTYDKNKKKKVLKSSEQRATDTFWCFPRLSPVLRSSIARGFFWKCLGMCSLIFISATVGTSESLGLVVKLYLVITLEKIYLLKPCLYGEKLSREEESPVKPS